MFVSMVIILLRLVIGSAHMIVKYAMAILITAAMDFVNGAIIAGIQGPFIKAVLIVHAFFL